MVNGAVDGVLAGRVALVTGGGTGIGRATAVAFAQAGATVVVAGRREQSLAETVAEVEAAGGAAGLVTADVSVEEQVAAMVATVVERNGGLHVACHSAGVPGSGRLLEEFTGADWERIVATNLGGVWACMKHETVQMRRQGGGAIVNIASIAGLVGYLHATPYTASKHGVVGLTRAAAIEQAGNQIRVNAVCPGPVLTPMLEQARAARGDGADEFYLRNIPLGRLGRVEEVAAAALWLASDAASYVTGQALAVDGGWTAQ